MSSQDAAINIALRFVDQAVAPYNKAMDRMVSTAVATAAAIGVSFSAVEVFKTGFDSVERFKLSVAEATAFITTFSEKSASGDLAGGFKDANDYAMRLIPALEAIDAKTIASGKDLTAMSNTLMQNGVLLDIDNQKQVQGFINIANALSLVTVGQNKDVQIRQEINALLQGQMRNTDRLPKLLAAIDPKLEEHLKLWKEQGTTVEQVGALLTGFGASADLVEETWAAVGSSLETVRDKVLRDGFLPVYKDILGLATEIRTSLVDTSGQLTPLAIDIQTNIGGAYKSLKLGAMEVKAEILRIGILLDKTGGTMSFLASLPSAIPAAIGVKSSQDRMQRMADYNIMFENRAADKDLALQRLADQYNAVEATSFVAGKPSKATAPGLKITEAVDDKAIKKAEQLAEQWTTTRRNLEQEINLSGLTGLGRKLQEVTDKATEYHLQFDKVGGKAAIDDWAESTKAVARQADEMERLTQQMSELDRVNDAYQAVVLDALPEEQQAVARLTEEYRKKQYVIQENLRLELITSEEAAATSAALAARQVEAIDEIKNKTDSLSQFQIQAFRNMQDAGANFFESLRTGSDDWLDNFVQMTLKMVDQWASAQMMMAMFGEDFGKGGKLGGAAGDAAGAVSSAWNDSSSWLGAVNMAVSSYFADGGIMTSAGSLPLHRYAGGGIANTPQLAMFGEGRSPEAYVPLPDGRSIPVTMKGGGGGNVTVQQTFHIDARGADPATDQRLRAAVEEGAERGYRKVIDEFRRGVGPIAART